VRAFSAIGSAVAVVGRAGQMQRPRIDEILRVTTLLEHDLYHAGEINRTRAMLQQDDAWKH
jgi:hypothetical protein